MLRVHFWISRLKICDIFIIAVYFLRTKFQDHTTSSFLVIEIYIFIFWKAMLQIASQNFPDINALNFFSVTIKDTGLPGSQREINLVIFHLNYILIHLNILPYSGLNWEYLKMSSLSTTLVTVSICNVNKHSSALQSEFIKSDNISPKHLDRKRLHLNPKGKDRLALNFL